MASPKNSIKIHEHCNVAPPSSSPLSLPLTFFDLYWFRFHPVECIFFYSLNSDPSFFYDKVVPKLKTSLSHTLQHFLPLAGNIVWPNDSNKPIIQYNPGDDGVSFLIAESDADFNSFLDNSPHDAVQSRSLVPRLESSDSFASVMSLQVTLFPNNGFSICISTHHAVLDGKSAIMFIKAWASLCRSGEESTHLVPELEPYLDREMIKDPTGIYKLLIKEWNEMSSETDPVDVNGRSVKILPTYNPKTEDKVRATFVLTRADLEKIKMSVLSKWDTVLVDGAESTTPAFLSTFVLTCSHVLVCVAKAIHQVEKERKKIGFTMAVDCRARLEPPIPENYVGNCVWVHLVDAQPKDFIKEDGVVIIAKSIHNKTKMLDKDPLQGAKSGLYEFTKMELSEGIEVMGVAGSNRFGIYEIDFGWGRPAKVEITSIDRGLAFSLAECRDGSGGVEVGLVLNKQVMGLLSTLFHAGL